MILKIIVFLHVIVLRVLGITDRQLIVYDSLDSVPLIIDPIESPIEPSGYTLCLRVRFNTWADVDLMDSAFFSFKLKNFSTGIGEFGNFEFKHDFLWKGVIPISILFWNSICASFNYTDLTLVLFVNRQILLNLTEKSLTQKYSHKDPLDLTIDLGLSSFSGQITDLNVWSRSLSLKDLDQYSVMCSNNLTESMKPDKVMWSRLNITEKNNLKSTVISRTSLCQQVTITNTTDTVIIRSSNPYFDYKTAYAFCKELNGNMPYPENKTELQQMLSINKDSKLQCFNRVWMAISKSRYNSSVLIYDKRTLPEKEITFGNLGRKDLSVFASSNDMCVYAEISSSRFFITECSIRLCSMCQFRDDKRSFSLKGFESYQTIDDTYAMVREDFSSHPFRIKGVRGKSFIENYRMEFVLRKKDCNDILAYSNATSLTPIGIRRWYWTSNNCSSGMSQATSVLLKLSNVS